MTIRPSTHALPLILGLLGVGLTGCSSAPRGLIARSEDGARSYLIDAADGYFWTDSDGVTDIVLVDEGTLGSEVPGKPGGPLLPGRERVLVHTVHIRVNWKQQPAGIGEPDPTNATLNWLIQERVGGGLVTLARYRGAGYARVDTYGRQASVTLKDVALRALLPAPGQPDPLDRFQLSGEGTVEESRLQVERLRGLLMAVDGLVAQSEPPPGGPPPRQVQP